MMNKKIAEYFDGLQVDLIHISQAFAVDNKSPQIEPVHIFRALLHKSAGLVNYIEDSLNEDYYYLIDWCDIHIQQCDKSPYPMKKAEFSRDSQNVIKEAISLEEQYGTETHKLEFLLTALVSPGVGFSSEQLKTMPLSREKVLSYISKNVKNAVNSSKEIRPSANDRKSQNVYYNSLFDATNDVEIIDMENDLRSLVEILARKDRANALIVGDTGVGKTSLIRKLTDNLTKGELPASISTIQPYELDLIALSQGVSYKGEMEDRFKSVIDELSDISQPVLVIENFYRLGETSSPLNAILPSIKKILSNNTIQFICTSSIDGYTKNLEKDRELTAYFEKISLEAPTEEEAIGILDSKKTIYEQYHNITLDGDVIPEIVRLAKRYMPERNLPASAIDLLDRSMASVKIEKEMEQTTNDESNTIILKKDEIRNVVAKMTGIPMGNIQSEERQRLSSAEDILHKRVVGQNHAIKSILDAVFESRSGLNKKGQPIGSFFFLGPTGTGKTELAKSLAEFLFNDDTSILRFDMSEYKEEHSVALLYGAPPGYVGYEEGGLLVNQIRQHPYSVVLFDEIEKAHRSVFDLFLQILDEGKLHDRLGRVGDDIYK